MKKKKPEEKRHLKRYTERCKTEFKADGKAFRGLSENFSLDGLFIKTNHPLPSGTIINISIYLPNGSISKLRGEVVRAIENKNLEMFKNVKYLKKGMGIKIIEKDVNYLHFIRSLIK